MKLYLKQKNKNVEAVATYYPEKKSFVVLKGSKISESIKSSPKFRGARSIEKQRADGVVVDCVVTRDVEFSSSSTAANFVTGASTNGLVVWKDASGKSLKDILAENE